MVNKYTFRRSLRHRQKAEALCDARGLSCHSHLYRDLVEEAYDESMGEPTQSVDHSDVGTKTQGNVVTGDAPSLEELENLQNDESAGEAPAESADRVGKRIPSPFGS